MGEMDIILSVCCGMQSWVQDDAAKALSKDGYGLAVLVKAKHRPYWILEKRHIHNNLMTSYPNVLSTL